MGHKVIHGIVHGVGHEVVRGVSHGAGHGFCLGSKAQLSSQSSALSLSSAL